MCPSLLIAEDKSETADEGGIDEQYNEENQRAVANEERERFIHRDVSISVPCR